MLIRKAYKFRLKASNQHSNLFARYAGCSRFLWNKALSLNKHRLEQGHRILRYQELAFWLTGGQASEEYGFLKECPAQVLQQKLQDLDRAYKDAFDKSQKLKRMPRFKKKGEGDNFRFPQGFKLEGNRIFLPKVGWLGFRCSQKIVGTLKNMTVSRVGLHWFVSIQTEQEQAPPIHPAKTMVGVDRGVKQFVVLSTGEKIAPINSLQALSQRLAQAQRRLAGKKKFSQNWKKQKQHIQKLHRRIANLRLDFLHKCSRYISKNHAMIVLEDLKIVNMTGSAKGTLDQPGKNVSAKSGLNRAILDQGWGEFARQLVYKQAWLGGEVLFVKPHYTSQSCPACGHVSKDNRKTQSVFFCTKCHHHAHADYVAAVNIKRAGHARLACGDIATVGLQAQEPLEASV